MNVNKKKNKHQQNYLITKKKKKQMKKEIKMITNFKTFKGIQKKKKKKSTILHTHFLHMYT